MNNHYSTVLYLHIILEHIIDSNTFLFSYIALLLRHPLAVCLLDHHLVNEVQINEWGSTISSASVKFFNYLLGFECYSMIDG